MRQQHMSDFDPHQIIETMETICKPGSVAEVRIILSKVKNTIGYFDDWAKLADAVRKYDARETVYVTLNEVSPDLLARANNRLREFGSATADHDIVRRRWLFIDFDPVRAAGISSTEAEHAAAKQRSNEVGVYLRGRGWPDPVVTNSGNGWHLLYPIDLPNTDEMKDLVSDCLQALSAMFGDDKVEIDQTTFNAARITKLYGTVATKGDHTDTRPHRRSHIAHVPKVRGEVSIDLLRALARQIPKPEPKQKSGMRSGSVDFDLPRWISEHGIPVKHQGVWKGSGSKWVLSVCPWNSDHTDNSAFIAQQPDGAIVAGCHHSGCHGLGWRDMRTLYEPDAYTRQDLPIAAPAQNPLTPAQLQALMPQSRAQVVRELHQVEPVPSFDGWEEPMPITESELPSFPVDAFPSILRDHAEESALSLQTPVDMQAMMILVTLAAVNSKRCKLQVGSKSRQHEEPLNLYIALASDPGSGKSRALKGATFPLKAIEREIIADMAGEYEARQQRWDCERKRMEHINTQAAKCADPGEADRLYAAADAIREEIGMVRPPACPSLLVQDISTERLSSLIAEQEDNTLALISAEGGIFSIIKGQYSGKGSGAPSMDIYLKAWSGEDHTVDRVGSGKTILPYPLLTVGLMVQPDVLRSLLETNMMKGNGFLDRFLYCVPPSLTGTRLYRDTGIVLTANYAYDKLIRALYDLPKSVTPDRPDKRFTITMSGDAIAVYAYFADKIEIGQRSDGELSGMSGWASKFSGHVARVAANLHMAKMADTGQPWDTQITGETMAEAVLIGEYLIPHARAAFGEMRADATTALARRILSWAQRRRATHFSMRDVWNGHRSIDNKEQIDAALLKLIEHSYLRMEMPQDEPSRRGPRMKPVFAVNPAVLEPAKPN